MSEIRQITITTRSPSDYDHEGACEIGWYRVENGAVQLTNETGTKNIGQPAKIGSDDPQRVAGRLFRAEWVRRSTERNASFHKDLGEVRRWPY